VALYPKKVPKGKGGGLPGLDRGSVLAGEKEHHTVNWIRQRKASKGSREKHKGK